MHWKLFHSFTNHVLKQSNLKMLAKLLKDDYFKILIFKLSDFDQGIHKTSIRNK